MQAYTFPERERALLEGLRQPLGIYQTVSNRVVTLLLSDGFLELFGYASREDAYRDMNRDIYRDVHPDDVARMAEASLRFAAEGGSYEVIYRARTKDEGKYRVIHSRGCHTLTETGERLAQMWYMDEGPYTEGTDMEGSALGRTLCNALHEESILKASRYDALTGLASMSYFFELDKERRAAVHQTGDSAALLYMDLNGLKFFNHSHSFEEGDKLLKAFARLLSQSFERDNCCRIGADHFLVCTAEAGLPEALEALFASMREINGGATLPVRVGIYCESMGDAPVSVACDRAKLACDSLKGSFVSAYHYYTRELSDELVQRRYVQENLDRALAEGWIEVYYQPIVRAVNGRVCDEEALARWIDPVKGLLSPAEFIPALESVGLSYRLDLYVLEQVLKKLKDQRDAGLYLVPQSINLSRADFDACDMVEEFRRRVDAAGLSRDKITVEITESVIGRDFEFMKEQIARFQSLGFPVWMDDFGSAYSSLDVLQSIKFNLLKFDMSFMRRLDESEQGRIILTELMKMASALGLDTVCEGVETQRQLRFLQEIGCSKLQGFYFCRPIPFGEIVQRYREGRQIGFEDPREAAYYETIGRVNLYDLAVIANEDETLFQNFFDSVPMSIMESRDDKLRFVRTNQPYRDFMKRFFGMDLSEESPDFKPEFSGSGSSFLRKVQSCCKSGGRAFLDEQMSDGSVVHSFVRMIGRNPVTGAAAVAAAVLSIADSDEGATYASIARALAADYYNIYYVDLDTDRFIEYSSPVGGEELALERHGENFFEACLRDAGRIHEEDRDIFFAAFNKENILRELNQQGVFTATYRLIDTGKPVYVNMKITRMQPDGNRIIIGISIIDAQMQQREEQARLRRERDLLARVMALNEDYLTLYSVHPDTDSYVEYNATDEYKSLGLADEGADFFRQSVINGKRTICEEDLPRYLEEFTKENILRAVRENGVYKLQYRLMLHGKPTPVSLKIAPFRDKDGEKLVVGVRAWKVRQGGR